MEKYFLGGRKLLPLLLLATALLATYAGGLGNGFVYDDHEVIGAQPAPQGAAGWARLFAEPHFLGLPYYRPLVRASLLAQKSLHGERPAAFRVVNVALLAGAAFAAFALLTTPALGVRPEPALLAAALFALHPVASSCVYPIASGRETLLPALLILLAVLAWLHGRRTGAWGLAALALLAKEQAVMLPALFALADATRLAPERPARVADWLRRYAPAAVLLPGYFAVRLALFGGSEWRLGFPEQPALPLLSYVYALQSSLAPFRALVYEPELAVWLSPARLALAAFVLAAGIVLGLRATAPPARSALFWLGWFVLVQLPTANLLLQEAPFAERYTFLAWLALPALAAGVVSAHWDRPGPKRTFVAAALTVSLGCAFVSAGRAVHFRNDDAFARQWLRTNPEAAEAHHLLALVRTGEGELGEALVHYERALEANPNSADLQVNAATALALVGRPAEARQRLGEALRLAPDHPEAHVNLGVLLARDGRLEEAVVHYRAALRVAPRMAEAHNDLATALARLGRPAEARRHLEEALRLAPDYADARRNLDRLQGR